MRRIEIGQRYSEFSGHFFEVVGKFAWSVTIFSPNSLSFVLPSSASLPRLIGVMSQITALFMKALSDAVALTSPSLASGGKKVLA